jgi:hypothetical protein
MRVLLFSGHRIDLPDRPAPRFPAHRVAAARRAIESALNRIVVAPGDRAITSGANGGDLLFAADCLRREAMLELWLPSAPERFIETSVLPGGRAWVAALDKVLAHPRTTLQVLPPTEGSGSDADAYARCNEAMLLRALALAGGPLEFVCLWDGGAGDGPGGTEHMVQRVRALHGQVHWIDTRTLADSGEQSLPRQV